MTELELLKELKEKTLEKIIGKFGGKLGLDLSTRKLTIWDVRYILYSTAREIAKRELKKEHQYKLKEWDERT